MSFRVCRLTQLSGPGYRRLVLSLAATPIATNNDPERRPCQLPKNRVLAASAENSTRDTLLALALYVASQRR